MRKIVWSVAGLLISVGLSAQDSLKTITLNEVVTIGTKIDVPIEKSGKTIVKLTSDEFLKNAGKSVADVLNEVPGIQMDGNFGTPGSNLSYYVRGGRTKATLILIDGVPLNDPSGITAEFDLRYLPISQVESIEILKGGLSTLYGTGASAGVIDIRLKSPEEKIAGGTVDVNAGSYGTYSENISVGGTVNKITYSLSGSNINSKGFSAALDPDGTNNFDDDGFDRQNGLLKLGYQLVPKLKIGMLAGYDRFKADYDSYEFVDAQNVQVSEQFRIGANALFNYSDKGNLSGYAVLNWNERDFESNFPSTYYGKNLQAEVIDRHQFNTHIQGLFGLNYQQLRYEQEGNNTMDTTKFTMVDPYASILFNYSFFDLHVGTRLNTHSAYGTKLVYNVNPSVLLNRSGFLRFKVLASLSTSYITPSLYQLYSEYGNPDLLPEDALNVEAGFSMYGGEKFTFNFIWFKRDESNPIDFVNIVDGGGNWVGGEYQNVAAERKVYGVELSASYQIVKAVSVSANYTFTDTDKPESFYRIPNNKMGLAVNVQPRPTLAVSVKYNFTGERTTFDYDSFSELILDSYQLVDLFASYGFLKNRVTLYGAINNVFDEQFIAVYGFTTRGRNFNAGLRFSF